MIQGVGPKKHKIVKLFSVPPSVEILKPSGLPYKMRSGEELALVCHGHGDPMPTLVWKREV